MGLIFERVKKDKKKKKTTEGKRENPRYQLLL